MKWPLLLKKVPDEIDHEEQRDDSEELKKIFETGDWISSNPLGFDFDSWRSRDGRYITRSYSSVGWCYSLSFRLGGETVYYTKKPMSPPISSKYTQEIQRDIVIRAAIEFVKKHRHCHQAREAGVEISYPKPPFDLGSPNFDLFLETFKNELNKE